MVVAGAVFEVILDEVVFHEIGACSHEVAFRKKVLIEAVAGRMMLVGAV